MFQRLSSRLWLAIVVTTTGAGSSGGGSSGGGGSGGRHVAQGLSFGAVNG